EVTSIRNKMVALQAWARQARDTTLITHATEIRIRAERRAGEMLRDMAARKQRATSRDTLARGRKLQPRETPKLADLGIHKTQSSRWQRLAMLDDEVFTTKVAAASKRQYASIASRFLKAAEIERAKERHAKIIHDYLKRLGVTLIPASTPDPIVFGAANQL